MKRRRRYRGIVGIEAAIVLIAFVIVAAALAFVTLNMGFFTTQKSQQVIVSGLGESSTALEVDGSVLAYSQNGGEVDYIAIPIKVSPGRSAVDLHPNRSSIVYWSGGGSFADIYTAFGYVYYDGNRSAYNLTIIWANGTKMFNNDQQIGGSINITAIWCNITSKTKDLSIVATIIWIDSNQDHDKNDTNLEIGEKAIVLVIFNDDAVKPEEYDVVKVEIKPPEGASLTIERTMPPGIASGVMDLG